MLPADAGSGRVLIERSMGPGLKSPVIFRPAPPSYPFPATSFVGRRSSVVGETSEDRGLMTEDCLQGLVAQLVRAHA